jgi:hypothetical protein
VYEPLPMRTTLVLGFSLVTTSAYANTVAIPTLKLKVEAPADTTVEANPNHDYVEVDASKFAFTVRAATASTDTKVEDAQGHILMKPTNVKTEKLSDGWVLSYEISDVGNKVRYMFTSYRTIGGSGFVCEGGDNAAATVKLALAACKSLHK